jgi:hypothetical protein
MPIQVHGVLVHAKSGTELSRVRTEFRLRLPEPINKSPLESRGPTLLCNQVPFNVVSLKARETFRHRIRLTGNSIPCSFPDRSLFQLGSKDQSFLLKYSALGSYCRMASTEDTKFPVFFPVSREFGWRRSSHGTASTASQSCYFSLFPSFWQKPGFSGLIARI